MRPLLSTVMAVALLGSANALAEDTMSLNQFPHRMEPVLVRVNAQGKVTDASPAYPLTLKFNRLLRANLDEMIHSPAVDKHGKPIPSQFIMNLALRTKPSAGGEYSAWFAYVSTAPVPPGSWYWVHLDGDRLALASPDMFPRGRLPRMPVEHYDGGYRPTYLGNNHPAPAPVPAIQNTAPSTTAVSSPPPRTH